MGSCQSCTPTEHTIRSEERSSSRLITKTKDFITHEKSKTYDDDNIAEECNLENSKSIPKFVQEKSISEVTIPKRTNRFLKDMEEEVKFRIKQILYIISNRQQEELEQLQQMNQSQVTLKQGTADFNNNSQIQSSVSFQNDKDFKVPQQTNSKTYLPRQISQFAPKRDTETVTQNSQISQTMNSYKMRASTPVKKIDDKSNIASFGSAKQDSNGEQFSDHFRESSSNSKQNSVRSILKNNSRPSRSITVKSTHTGVKSKKVSFSNDTNINTSRTTKKPGTNVLKK